MIDSKVLKIFMQFPLLKIGDHSRVSEFRYNAMHLSSLNGENPTNAIVHKLCHFLERENHKVFLPSMGFNSVWDEQRQGFATQWKSTDSIRKGYLRELRVCALERNVWKFLNLGIKTEYPTGSQILEKIDILLYYENYGSEAYLDKYFNQQLAFYSESNFNKLFDEKYALLKSKVLAVV